MNEQVYKILIIDDSAEDRVTFRYYLQKNRDCRYEFLEAELGETAVKICLEAKPDCVLLAFNLPESDGLTVMHEINPDPLNPKVAVVLMSDSGNEAIAVNALKNGAQDYLVKGKITPEDLHLSIQKAVKNVRLRNEQLQTLKDLRQSEERLSLALKGTNIGAFDWNIKTGAIEWTREIENAAAMSTDDFDSSFEGFIKVVHPEDRAMLRQRIEATLKDGDYECEFRMLKGDGGIRWVIGKGRVFFDDEGNPARLVGVDIDITKRKLAEESMIENQRFTNSIIETAPGVLYIFDLKTKNTTYLTEQAAQILGFSSDEEKTNFLERNMHPDDAKLAEKHFQQITQTSNGRIFEFEYRMRHKSGEWRWFRSRDRVFKRDENGAAAEILGIALDITERKQATDEIREGNQRMRLATAATNVGVWEWNVLTNQIRWDEQMFRLYGIEPTQDGFVPYTAWSESVLPDELARQEKLLQETLRRGGQCNREFHIRRNDDGAIRYIEAVETVRLNHKGQPEWVLGTNLDVTERKLAEDELRASEEFSRTVLEGSPDCVKILDGEGLLKYMNSNGMCLMEIDDFAPFKNKFWWDLWAEETQPVVKESLRKALKGETAQFQAFRATAKGTPKWWDVIVSLIPGTNGKQSRIISVSRDITESKIRESNLAFIAEISRDFAPLSSADEIMRMASARIADYLKLSHCLFVEINEAADEAEVIYDHHTDDLPNLVGVYRIADFNTEQERQHFTSGNSITINNVRDKPRSADAIAQFEALGIGSLVSVPYNSGGMWRFILTAQHSQPYQWRTDEIELLSDLASRIWTRIERARTEEKLRESEERFRAIFDSIDEGFCIVELIFDENNKPIDYRFVQANPAMERLTGLKDALGKTARELVPDLEEFWFETYGKVALKGESVRFENYAKPLNRWFEVYASRVGDSTSRVAIVFNNITERKLAEQEREESFKREQILRRQAEDASRAKDEFLAMLSHELRSPLNAMLGWATMLKLGNMDSEQTVHAVNLIERNTRLQNALIEDLLDVSRIISGKMRLEPANISFISVVQNALDTARQAAAAKGIELAAALDPAADEMHGDIFRLQQMIGNLLTNAIKFTPQNGNISVSLQKQNDTAKLIVKDSGIGIAPELLPHIFDRFQQADASTKRQFGGLGLGLTIVKNLVELHGGTITAHSDGIDSGSEFVIELPLLNKFEPPLVPREKRPDNSSLENKTAKIWKTDPFANKKILVVDDESDSLELIRYILIENGAEVSCVNSAKEVLQALHNDKFDLLISDLGMPEMDGYDLIREIRQTQKEYYTKIPAIALTGYVSADDRARVLQAGFQTHLPKPLDIENLLVTVLNLISK